MPSSTLLRFPSGSRMCSSNRLRESAWERARIASAGVNLSPPSWSTTTSHSRLHRCSPARFESNQTRARSHRRHPVQTSSASEYVLEIQELASASCSRFRTELPLAIEEFPLDGMRSTAFRRACDQCDDAAIVSSTIGLSKKLGSRSSRRLRPGTANSWSDGIKEGHGISSAAVRRQRVRSKIRPAPPRPPGA